MPYTNNKDIAASLGVSYFLVEKLTATIADSLSTTRSVEAGVRSHSHPPARREHPCGSQTFCDPGVQLSQLQAPPKGSRRCCCRENISAGYCSILIEPFANPNAAISCGDVFPTATPPRSFRRRL